MGNSCKKLSSPPLRRGHNVTAIIMGLNGSAAHPRASQALSSMLSRNALNPADITNLYKLYSAADPPPVELIRLPQFMGMTVLCVFVFIIIFFYRWNILELLLDSLFKPGVKLNPEHKSKYNYLLAYAASVAEVYKKNQRKNTNRDELKATMQVRCFKKKKVSA